MAIFPGAFSGAQQSFPANPNGSVRTAKWFPLITIPFGSILATYGAPQFFYTTVTNGYTLFLKINNTTAGTVVFSFDGGTNDHLVVGAGEIVNHYFMQSRRCSSVNFCVRFLSTLTSGSVYIGGYT